MQRISELDRAGKVDLLKRVQAGEIDPNKLTPDTILITDPDEAFLGLMVAGSSDPEDPADVLIAGDAEKCLSRFLEDVQKGEQERDRLPE
jgi:hypothetical protein